MASGMNYGRDHHKTLFLDDFVDHTIRKSLGITPTNVFVGCLRQCKSGRILFPIRRLSALIEELNFNLEIVRATPLIASPGVFFRDDEFHEAFREGALSTLPLRCINQSMLHIFL